MKKILLLSFTIVLATTLQAKDKTKKESMTVDFYGIDFSAVTVIGAAETEDQFKEAFVAINKLLVSEQPKYNVGKFLKLNVASLRIDHAVRRVDHLNGVNFKESRDSKPSLEEVVEACPTNNRNVLLIVAKELNKSRKKATFVAVVFDGQTKQIISQKEFRGKAKGFGLRNFWAGSLYYGLKSVR